MTPGIRESALPNLCISVAAPVTALARVKPALRIKWVTGLKAMHSNIPVLGIGVNAPRDMQEQRVYKLACETAKHIGAPDIVLRDNVVAKCDYIGAGCLATASSCILKRFSTASEHEQGFACNRVKN